MGGTLKASPVFLGSSYSQKAVGGGRALPAPCIPSAGPFTAWPKVCGLSPTVDRQAERPDVRGVRGQNRRIRESENRRISGGRKAGKPSGYPLSGRQAIGHWSLGHWSFGHWVILIALSGIGGVRTPHHSRVRGRPGPLFRLNALSGIGGVRTFCSSGASLRACLGVLMPCRALEAFGLLLAECDGWQSWVLMPCRALEAFGRARCPFPSTPS